MVELEEGTNFVFLVTFIGLVIVMGLLFLNSITGFFSSSSEYIIPDDQIVSDCESTSTWSYYGGGYVPALSSEHIEGSYSISMGKQSTSYIYAYGTPRTPGNGGVPLDYNITNAKNITMYLYATEDAINKTPSAFWYLHSDWESGTTEYKVYSVNFVDTPGWNNWTLDLETAIPSVDNGFNESDFDAIMIEFYTPNPAVLIAQGDVKVDYPRVTYEGYWVNESDQGAEAVETIEDSLLDITSWLPVIIITFFAVITISLLIGKYYNKDRGI